MSRDFLPAPPEWRPGGRRRRHKRRRHGSRSRDGHGESRRSSSSSSRRSSSSSGRSLASDVVTAEDPRANLPPLDEEEAYGHRRRRSTSRRRKRGLMHGIRRIRRRRRSRHYAEFIGRGSSPRQIARRYEQQRRRRKRLVVGAAVTVILGAGGAVLADGYVQSVQVLERVRDSGEALKQVRSNLIRGKLPPEAAFATAAKEINEAQVAIDGARPTWRISRVIPFFGLPVSATERLVNASRHELGAALAAKDLLEAILGQTIEEAEQEAADRQAQREALRAADLDGNGRLSAEERDRFREKGGVLPGDGPEDPVQDDPDALLSNGAVNLRRLRELIPDVEGLKTELAAAEAEIQGIGSVPFVSKVEELRLDLIGEIQESHALAERALAGLNFIPAFLGSNDAKNYLMLFSDSGYLRGTGGAYFAYAEIAVKGGKLNLVNQGPIIDLDRYVNEPVDHVVPPDNWYLETFPLSKRMNNLNWDPHFPNTAPVAAEIYKLRTAGKDINGVVKPEGRQVDGVFQIDVTGVSYLVDAIGPIVVDSWEDPIGGNNLERIALIDSYVELSEGGDVTDASDSGQARKAFNEDLVQATWRSLQEPDDLVRTVFQLSRALAQRHMQVWVRNPKQQAFFQDLGWAGAIEDTPGDYLYVVDQNLGNDTLDVFSAERVNYDVAIEDDGDLDVTATVSATNFVDESMPFPIVDIEREPTKRTYVNLYAPSNAELQSVTFSDRFETFPYERPLVHDEAGRKVFSARMATKAHETASLIFKYRVPGGLLDEDGELYRLTMQRQPRYNDQSIRVRVTFPEGWDPRGFDDEIWTVTGNRAEAFFEKFEEDRTIELRF